MDIRVVIYCLVDPRDNSIFYVGQTSAALTTRLGAHVSYATIGYGDGKNRFIGDMLTEGYRPEIVALEETSDEQSVERETEWIAFLRKEGAKLYNATYPFSLGRRGKLGSRRKQDRGLHVAFPNTPVQEGGMPKKDFSSNRINVYVPEEMRGKIDLVAAQLIANGEQGLVKRDGTINVSALFERLLERELQSTSTTP